MRHRTPILFALLALVCALFVAGCTAASPTPTTPPGTGTDGGAAGMRLAPGLYDQEDGTVLALGTLEWQDLEGGFWAIIGLPETEGQDGAIAAVIAEGGKDDPALAPLAGKFVEVKGTRNEGASIRMAGPEITVTSISEITDTPGAAE